MADIPEAPKHRPDLAVTWGIVAQMEKRSEAGYREAAQRIRARVAGYGHIGVAELAEIQRMIDAELGKLAAQQNSLLFQGMAAAAAAAALGVRNGVPDAAAEQLLVRHLVDKVHSDGLNLSARLWRVHQGAAQDMKSIVDVAVQRGWSAEKVLQHTLEITPELRQALEEADSGAIAQRLERGLLHDSGNGAAKFRRVLRTEINTAHGERYKQMVRDDPEAVGLRFMLSPRHPRVDICDTHATADLYNLGPGVYPVDACPWPAHPNTFSYIEVVFESDGSADIISDGLNDDKITDMQKHPTFTGNVEVNDPSDYQLNKTVFSSRDLIGLSGAPDGARLVIDSFDGGVSLDVSSEFFTGATSRFVYLDDVGLHLVLYNARQSIKLEYQQLGLGVFALREQVIASKRVGVRSMQTEAAGDFTDELVGYYVWPRLGFNGKIPDGLALPPALAAAEDILDLMGSEEGRLWWRQHGRGFDAEFDLQDGSKSIRMLEQYLNEKWRVALWDLS